MQYFAYVTEGVIDNIIVYDPVEGGNFDLSGYTEITDAKPRPSIGWRQSGTTWQPPDPPAESLIKATENEPQISAQTPDIVNDEKYDTVVPEQEEQTNGPTENNRSATTEGNGL